MSTYIPDDDHLMVSYVDQRGAIDAIAKLLHDDPPSAAHEFTLFPFDAGWADTPVAVIGYSVPPTRPL